MQMQMIILLKPFGTSELLARVRTAIRHARATVLTAEGMQTGQFRAGDLLIDYDKHRVYVGDRDVNLTQNEYKIVSLLGKYAGKVLTYDFIIKEIWGPNMQNDNRILRLTWQISGGRWKITRHSLSIFLQK